jgi:hypothetical protein
MDANPEWLTEIREDSYFYLSRSLFYILLLFSSLGFEQLDSCLDILEFCLQSITSVSVLNLLNHLFQFQKFQSELIRNSSEIYAALFSSPLELFENLEFLRELLTFTNNLLEGYLEGEISEGGGILMVSLLMSSFE